MNEKKRKYPFILAGILLSIGILLLSWKLINSLDDNNSSQHHEDMSNKQLSDRKNLSESSFVGVDQSYLIEKLGAADEIEELVRREEHVFGPIEDLWYKIKMGEKIITWKYETRDGRKELYFVNDSTEVVGEFYWYDDLEKNPVFQYE